MQRCVNTTFCIGHIEILRGKIRSRLRLEGMVNQSEVIDDVERGTSSVSICDEQEGKFSDPMPYERATIRRRNDSFRAANRLIRFAFGMHV